MKTFIKKNNYFSYFNEISDAQIILWINSMIEVLNIQYDIVYALKTSSCFFKEKHKKRISIIVENIESGQSFYKACCFSRIFPKYCLDFFKINENNGDLKRGLTDLKDFLEWKVEQKNKMINGLIYPLVSFCVFIFTVFVFSDYILPELLTYIADVGEVDYVYIFLKFISVIKISSILLILFLISLYFVQKTNKRIYHIVVLNTPFLKDYYYNYVFYINSYNINISLKNQNSLKEGLNDCISVSDGIIKENLIFIKRKIEKGFLLSEILEKLNFIPKELLQMVKIGEKTDQVGMFLYIEKFYKKKYFKFIEKTTTILPLFFIILTSIFILSFILIVFLPLYNLGSEF